MNASIDSELSISSCRYLISLNPPCDCNAFAFLSCSSSCIAFNASSPRFLSREVR